MESIVIFTNYNSINHDQDDYKLSWVPNAEKSKHITVTNSKSLHIIYDNITTNAINDLSNHITKCSTVYILHHDKPLNDFLGLFKNTLKQKGCKIKPIGKHHYDPEYKMIQKIDKYGVKEATKNLNELEKVFDELKRLLLDAPILYAKVELIYNCLVPESIPTTLNSLLSSYDIVFNTFQKEINKKSAFDKEYIDALTKFRNALLDF